VHRARTLSWTLVAATGEGEGRMARVVSAVRWVRFIYYIYTYDAELRLGLWTRTSGGRRVPSGWELDLVARGAPLDHYLLQTIQV
jgi:hypothetical protein